MRLVAKQRKPTKVAKKVNNKKPIKKRPTCTTARKQTFHTTKPQNGVLSSIRGFFKRHADIDELKGEYVGTDPNGHKFYEWQDPRLPTSSPPRRRVEYVNGEWQPDQIHVFWDAWLRHSRKNPPSEQEMQRYNDKMKVYHERVKMHQDRDAKLRREEQMQRKLTGEQINQDDMSAQNYLRQLEAQMEKIKQGAAQDIEIQQKQWEEENPDQSPGAKDTKNNI